MPLTTHALGNTTEISYYFEQTRIKMDKCDTKTPNLFRVSYQ